MTEQTPLSPSQAFALGYETGDEQRRAGVNPDDPKGDTIRPRSVPRDFADEWERGFRAGIRGEPAPTVNS